MYKKKHDANLMSFGYLLSLMRYPKEIIFRFHEFKKKSFTKTSSSTFPWNLTIFKHWEQEPQSGFLQGSHFPQPLVILDLDICRLKTVSNKWPTNGVVEALVAIGGGGFFNPDLFFREIDGSKSSSSLSVLETQI